MTEIDWRTAFTRNTILDNFRNWYSMDFGRKVRRLYLVVSTLFAQNCGFYDAIFILLDSSATFGNIIPIIIINSKR